MLVCEQMIADGVNLQKMKLEDFYIKVQERLQRTGIVKSSKQVADKLGRMRKQVRDFAAAMRASNSEKKKELQVDPFNKIHQTPPKPIYYERIVRIFSNCDALMTDFPVSAPERSALSQVLQPTAVAAPVTTTDTTTTAASTETASAATTTAATKTKRKKESTDAIPEAVLSEIAKGLTENFANIQKEPIAEMAKIAKTLADSATADPRVAHLERDVKALDGRVEVLDGHVEALEQQMQQNERRADERHNEIMGFLKILKPS